MPNTGRWPPVFSNIVSWCESTFHLGDVRRSRALGEMAWGLMNSQLVSFAAIGRKMKSDASAASSITRTFKWCHNKHIKPLVVQEALLVEFVEEAVFNLADRRVATVALDWHSYDNGRISSLRVSLMTGSRALPLYWLHCLTSELGGQRNKLERKAVRFLRRIQPLGVTWLMLLDAGFVTPELIPLLDDTGCYIVRTSCTMKVHAGCGCWVSAGDLPIRVGEVVEFGWLHRGKHNTETARLVAGRIYAQPPVQRGLRSTIRKYKNTKPGLCLLSTNLPCEVADAATVIQLYGRRFEIEHSFRDLKNATLGMDMEHVHLDDISTYDRLMCIVAVAEALLWMVGAEAEALGLHRRLSPSQPRDASRRVLSLRNVGVEMLKYIDRSVRTLIRTRLLPAIRDVVRITGATWKRLTTRSRMKGLITERSKLGKAPDKKGVRCARRPECAQPIVIELAAEAEPACLGQAA